MEGKVFKRHEMQETVADGNGSKMQVDASSPDISQGPEETEEIDDRDFEEV